MDAANWLIRTLMCVLRSPSARPRSIYDPFTFRSTPTHRDPTDSGTLANRETFRAKEFERSRSEPSRLDKAVQRESDAMTVMQFLAPFGIHGRPRETCGAISRQGTTASPVLRPPLVSCYSKTRMFFAAQISLSCFGHTVALTSPRCAIRSRYMQRRDWPIPPPMESGISSLRIAW